MQELKSPAVSVPYVLASQVKQRTKLVITDVDGTLASFWDYFVPAVRDFLKELSVRLDTPIQGLAEDIGRIIERRGTHEYPWLLEETSFAWKHFADKPEAFVEGYVKPFWRALDENRAKYLRPFPQVLETLAALKARGVKIVALSDAPEYMARVRNKQIFDGLLDAVYALENVEPPVDDIWQPITLEYGRKRLREMRQETSDLKTKLVVLPKENEKPCPDGLDRVLRDFDVFPHEALFIGDSLPKDGLVAASRGIRFVWAHYGYQLPAEYEEWIHYSLKPEGDKLVSEGQTGAATGSGEASVQTAHRVPLVEAIAARYDELLNHL